MCTPRDHPDRVDDVDLAIGELSSFHQTFGYYAQEVSPKTAIRPAGWEQRLIPLSNENTGGATGLCLDVHDLALSKYAAGREKDKDLIEPWHAMVASTRKRFLRWRRACLSMR